MRRNGFTLVEMLVVIGIIGILIVALVPTVKGVQTKAKEKAVMTQCANIETALANYAQSHNGAYPGVALDCMSPFGDHALGDPAFYAFGAGSGVQYASAGRVSTGLLGGGGYRNGTSQNVFEQIKSTKDATPNFPSARERWFDSLILADAIQEYPSNPFITSISTGQRDKMKNIFFFQCNVGAGFDPTSTSNGWTSALYTCGLRTRKGGSPTGVTVTNDYLDTSQVFLQHAPVVPMPWNPATFSDNCRYGTNENDYFAAGDFAYVPVLSASSYDFGNSAMTLENEAYKWGTSVTGYMIFGYGDKSHRGNTFEDEQREFVQNGLPGYGGVGIDTLFEDYVLQLFEGAIYFNKKI